MTTSASRPARIDTSSVEHPVGAATSEMQRLSGSREKNGMTTASYTSALVTQLHIWQTAYITIEALGLKLTTSEVGGHYICYT